MGSKSIISILVVLMALSFQNCSGDVGDLSTYTRSGTSSSGDNSGSGNDPTEVSIDSISPSITKLTGENVSFTVTASGANDLTYQWNFNGNAISGAVAATLELTNLVVGDAGNYTVTVSSASLNDSETSNVIGLGVNVNPTQIFNNPTIRVQNNDYVMYLFNGQNAADAVSVRAEFCKIAHAANSNVLAFSLQPAASHMRYALYQPATGFPCSAQSLNQGQVGPFCALFNMGGFTTQAYASITCQTP